MNFSPCIRLIKLTRLNGKPFTLNAIFIEQVESFPDTTITLTNGKKFVVKDSEDDVILMVKKFYSDVSVLGLSKKMEGPHYEE